jgi:hypothetical protein
MGTKMVQHHILQAADNGPALTYSATGAAVLFWGLHVSDIAVMVSALASLLGVSLQFYLAMHRIGRLERASRVSKDRADVAETDAHVLAHRVDEKEKERGAKTPDV